MPHMHRTCVYIVCDVAMYCNVLRCDSFCLLLQFGSKPPSDASQSSYLILHLYRHHYVCIHTSLTSFTFTQCVAIQFKLSRKYSTFIHTHIYSLTIICLFALHLLLHSHASPLYFVKCDIYPKFWFQIPGGKKSCL